MPAARRTISNHIETMLDFFDFRSLDGVWMSIDIWHTTHGNDLRISMGRDDVDFAVSKWRLTYRRLKTDAADPTLPSIRWPTASASGERPASTLHATFRVDHNLCAMATLLHMAPSRLDKRQCATLYVPGQPTTAAPTSHPRSVRLHASMAKGGQLLATAGIYTVTTGS